mmetsp:Transcript_43872/g.103758  ORF Transcript_43872/g.103758 Transcript_43872/m.103758 type:complete len:202 (+) Transcript_43872:450-1055(+)
MVEPTKGSCHHVQQPGPYRFIGRPSASAHHRYTFVLGMAQHMPRGAAVAHGVRLCMHVQEELSVQEASAALQQKHISADGHLVPIQGAHRFTAVRWGCARPCNGDCLAHIAHIRAAFNPDQCIRLGHKKRSTNLGLRHISCLFLRRKQFPISEDRLCSQEASRMSSLVSTGILQEPESVPHFCGNDRPTKLKRCTRSRAWC